ncbi:50S ribosomal protein L9 [Sporomusa sphaeroides]|jgi:large subunit ribosomal protein L9|uniref:Large ribosomal subunit protein bL9 n=1 Tax=Sporomusa sphaeroides DSM 2875 TaxID=1337886 RepID=A0ABP2C257_9FIRM|nr:50S ribosomal protein L9 [Sporomusa sphaeroides]OLS56442.1 50S ribosomal protein L9 [Sporomusa sphaeroides DSM 2875]CVK18537.1 50S ribosomal protein L9 [Sporomusa sphaeroides DSM 2875]HML35509.1 50S ribosomal protein L9 [Sporomusa sphaeroides]
MKVILQQEVKKLGKKGDIIEVSEGYARNYLLPQKLAIAATANNVNNANLQKAAEERKKERALDEAKLLAAQMAKIVVTIPVKMGEGGRLFGSVTAKDIAEAVAQEHKLDLDKRKIELKDAIKSLGTFTVPIKLHPEVSTEIQVIIKAD